MSDVECFIQRQKHTQDFFDRLTYHIYQGFLEDCRALFLKKYRGQDTFF
ncbi:Uncharacterised protein [Moraxella equi]|uniref:Uncharacterized protein n=1 Tax=Moraxella equi TaxID=60442 RepID=A0A378QT39_9GAMM|nr:Uncharacterised protein [Moraxella equi]